MPKIFRPTDYKNEDDNSNKNKIFTPAINESQSVSQSKTFNPSNYTRLAKQTIDIKGSGGNIAAPSIKPKTDFWDKVRNEGDYLKNSISNTKVGKFLSDNPVHNFLESLAIKTDNSLMPGSSQEQAKDLGKIGNKVTDVAGSLLSYATPIPGLQGENLFSAANKIVSPLESQFVSKYGSGLATKEGAKLTQNILPKLGQYGVSGLKTGLEFGGINALQSNTQGDSWQDTGKKFGEGLVGGAVLGAAGKGIEELIPKVIPKVINKFNPKTEVSPNPIYETSLVKDNVEPSIKSNVASLETKVNQIKELDYNKVNDPKLLENHIAELETAMTKADEPTMQKMNLQLFAAKERLKKIQSKFYANTLQKTDVLSQAEKELLNSKDFEYTRKTEKESLEKARQRIDNNITKEIIDLNNKTEYSGEDVDTMMGILGDKYLKEARKTGNYSNVSDWLKNVRKAGLEGGRTVQAFAKYSRTKEGKLIEAQRVVDNVEEGLKKTNPKVIQEINTEAKKIEDTINTAHKDAVEEVAKGFDIPKDKKELLPSEILANKIESTTKPKTPQEKSLIDKMVSELFSVAKESPIKTIVPNLKPNALSEVSEALNNRQLYTTVWDNAKKIVTEEFKDNPEAMAILNNYFNKGIKPPFSMAKFNKAFNDGIKDLNINMGDVVRNYYKKGTETKEGLIKYLVEKSGLSGDEAKTLANTIDTKFREVKKQKAEEYLKGIFKEKPTVKAPNPLGKIEALSNTGGFVNENYKNKVKEKLTPELRKLIGFNPKETTLRTVDKSIMSFEDIVRGGVGKIGVQRKLFLDSLKDTLNVNPKDAETILKVAEEEFNKLAKDKQTQILNNMFKERPKPQQKNIVDKVMELINLEAYDKESIRDLIKEKKGLPVLNKDDIKYIVENTDKANSFPEGSYENRMYFSKVTKLIAEKEPTTGIGKLQAAQRLSMLLNPKSTVVRNPLGNTLLNGMESLKKNTFGVPLDTTTTYLRNIVRTKKGLPLVERTQLFNPLKDAIESGKGFKTGVSEWRKDIINGVDTSPVGGGVELPSKTKIFNENSNNPVQRTINKAANKVHFVVGKALKLGDTPFYNAAYSERISELKRIYKTNEITDAMKEDAVQYGLERTLQNDSALAELFTGFKQGHFIKDNHQGAKIVYQTFANLILPFAKTPANVLDKFIDYSPAGVLKATGHALYTAGKGTFNQKKFVDTMARGLTGTGLATLGYLMAKKDLITGASNSNNKVEGLENSLGKQNYAFKIGNTYQTVDWALPAAAPIMMGADIYNSVKGNSDFPTALKNGTGSAVNLMFNSTLLQGPSKLTGGYNPAASIGKTLLNTTTQATPSIGKQISQLADPYVRETYDPNPLKQTLNKSIARIPFASKTLPVKQDSFGNDIKAFQGKNNVWNVMFNPGFKTTYNPNDVQKEIIRLYDDSGETKQLPPTADKIISATKEKVYKTKPNVPGTPEVVLSGKEYTEYQKLIGIYSLEVYNKIIKSSSYESKTDEEKAALLGNELEKAKAKAKTELLKRKGLIK